MIASSMGRCPCAVSFPEQAGYFSISDEYLYTVLHAVENPVARILLVGPFASERHHSYWAWVRWARFLASKRIEVLRFDYRGVGESTGDFQRMTFDSWVEDIDRLSAWLKGLSPRRAFLLHGLEMGAILAARSFASGNGDAVLLWSPPVDANVMLRSNLIRWIAPQQLVKRVEERKPPSHYFELLQNGHSVSVDGYEWSAELWRQSFDLALPTSIGPPQNQVTVNGRPVRSVKLGKQASPFVRGGLAGFEEAKDFNWLFEPECEWLLSTVASGRMHDR